MRLQASDELYGAAAVTSSTLWSDLSVPITQPTMCPWTPMCSSIYLRVTNGQRLAEAQAGPARCNGQHSCAVGHSPVHYSDRHPAFQRVPEE